MIFFLTNMVLYNVVSNNKVHFPMYMEIRVVHIFDEIGNQNFLLARISRVFDPIPGTTG